MKKISTGMKTAIVLAGFLAALVGAYAILKVYQTWFVPPGVDTSGGMAAFGDMVLFLGAWAFLSLFPTALALFFLRSYDPFWDFFSIGVLALAQTGALWLILDLALGISQSSTGGWVWVSFLGMLRLGGSPLLAGSFAVFTLFAPAKRPRLFLGLATAIEGVVGLTTYILFIFGHHFP
jgi:hypothetical protein